MRGNDAMTTSTGRPEVGEAEPSDLPTRAAALASQLRERADEAAAAGTLPAGVVGLLESAGMFRLGLPRGLGGFEADPATLLRTAEVLAYADGSAAWATMTGNSSMFFAWLDQGVAAGLLDGRPRHGSGSHDVVADDVFVPAERTLMPFVEPRQADGALYRMPFFTAVRSLLMGIPLGVARRALDELTELCRQKTREMAPLIQDQDVQIRLAEAEAALRAARSFVLDLTERTWAAVQAGEEVPLPLRTEYTLAAQFAMRSAVQAVDLAFGIAGVSSALAGDAIQRCWRDVNVASQHIAYSRGRWRGAGQALLGLEIDSFYL